MYLDVLDAVVSRGGGGGGFHVGLNVTKQLK